MNPPPPSKLYLVNFWTLVAFQAANVGWDIWQLTHGRLVLWDLGMNFLIIASVLGANAGQQHWYRFFCVATALAALGGVTVTWVLSVARPLHPLPLHSIAYIALLAIDGILPAVLMIGMFIQINRRWGSQHGPRRTPGGWEALGDLADEAPKPPAD